VREHGRPSEGISVVDLSFGEEDDFLDTSHDEEFTRRLFDDLNRGLLGPLGDEEEEVREEDTVDAEATPPSIVNSPTQPSPPSTLMMCSKKSKMIIVMVETRSVILMLSRQKGCAGSVH
jgi:hypothetical protein